MKCVGALMFTAAWLFAIAPAPAGEMVHLGSHPFAIRTGKPGIHALKAFQGRLYMGHGGWTLSGSITAIASYDPLEGKFHVEFSSYTGSIGIFREIRGRLYVPAMAPEEYADYRELIYWDSGVWRDHAPTGMGHVFDVASLGPSDLWLIGSKTVDETVGEGGAVYHSTDDGRTWRNVTLPTNSRNGFVLRGNLYVGDVVYEGGVPRRLSGLGALGQIHKTSAFGEGPGQFAIGVEGVNTGDSWPIIGSLATFDTQKWRYLRTGVLDYAVEGEILYTLESDPNTDDRSLWKCTSLS